MLLQLVEGGDGVIKLKRIIEVSRQAVQGYLFYITLEATNASTGVDSFYELKIWSKLDGSFEVEFFRPALIYDPSDDYY